MGSYLYNRLFAAVDSVVLSRNRAEVIDLLALGVADGTCWCILLGCMHRCPSIDPGSDRCDVWTLEAFAFSASCS